MKRPYTNKELFSIINSRLKDAGVLPDILDYGLEASDEVAIRSYHWDTIGIVNFGGSEGIYLDIYAWGNVTQEDRQEKIKLATYKTLSESKQAFKVMSDLNAEFVFATKDFVNAHLDDFQWTGWTIRFYDENDDNNYGVICYRNGDAIPTAKRYLRQFSDRYSYAVVIENSTRKETKIIKED